jgi:hypothetical protein
MSEFLGEWVVTLLASLVPVAGFVVVARLMQGLGSSR